jgi:hypothetical protein
LGAHAKFQNPTTCPSVVLAESPEEEEEEERENNA